ncbi:MAG: GNAT family N-acetyltransferase, partial [Hyphomonas sp.]|nr:GNAT family N-acetyltransferase [Hyphomonas sp.]
LDAELLSLTELYAPPNGRMLIAEDAYEILGGVAYKRIDAQTCEMKRLFVRTTANGRGLGRKLCEALMQAAGREGFKTMRLDTTRDMVEAIGLYRSFGFKDVAPFTEYPERMRPMMLFMERALD